LGLLAAMLFWFSVSSAIAQSGKAIGFDPYVTLAGNFDVGYHQTQFFEPHHNTAVGQWDTRVEIWLPPSRKKFSWGPYLHLAGIGASQSQPWENAWLGGPGVGMQIYPFSASPFRRRDSKVGNLLGPLRVFAEFNRLDYWGAENSWRPTHQVRAGAEYWRARHVNSNVKFWWSEIWSGAWWQSANEFAPHYNTGIFASAVRTGLRVPNAGFLSVLTPYAAMESSLTDNRTYYWENKLVAGGGLRLAPAINKSFRTEKWINRFAVYGEYVHVAAYYRQDAPSTTPDHDLRVGITFSLGQWYR